MELTIDAQLAGALEQASLVLVVFDGPEPPRLDGPRIHSLAGPDVLEALQDGSVSRWLDDRRRVVGFVHPHDPDLPAIRDLLAGWEHRIVRLEVARHLAGYVADTDIGEDRLGITPDVEMMSDLVASRLIKPPLSIGLFGNWGSGKSFFMRQMRLRVRALADAAAAEEKKQGKHGTDVSSYCSSVRQITFNAWHYAEANLWASLAAHIFDNLASGGSEDDLARRADQLAKLRGSEKSLLTQLSAARLERMMVAAQYEREPFTLDLTRDDFHWVGKAMGVPDASIDQVREFARGMLGWRAKARQVASLFRHSKLAWILTGCGLALTVGLVLLVRSPLWVPLLTFVSTVVAAVTPFAREVHKAVGRIKSVVDTKKASTAARLESLSEETARLERAVAELAHDMKGFAASRQASSDYRQHLGVVSLLRRDLETFAAILSAERDAGGLERIVLYIDDLDRCAPDVVVKVLEAIHLLVALPVFVVVVAVDARWLRQAIARHYESMQLSPANYLEKIFQVPFQLSAMDRAGFGDLVRTLAGSSRAPAAPVGGAGRAGGAGKAGGAGEPTAPAVPAVPADGPAARAGAPAAPATSGDGPTAPAAPAGGGTAPPSSAALASASSVGSAPAPAAPVVSNRELRPRQLDISAAELDFLGRLAPLVSSPRSAKRLINLYRLLRSRLSGEELNAFVSGDGAGAALVLLAVHAGDSAAADALFNRIGAAGSGLTSWRALLDRYREDSDVSTLCDLLAEIEGMPDSLAVYRTWLPLVRRFSFGH